MGGLGVSPGPVYDLSSSFSTSGVGGELDRWGRNKLDCRCRGGAVAV